MKLLIADDEPLEREVMSMIIRQHNPQVTQLFEARNGEEAVHIARQEQMDLVFMDIKMPLLNGLAAARQIQAEQPDCRIIFLTAYDEAYLGERLAAGTEYLLKPGHPDDIRQTLVQYIPQSQQIPKYGLPKHTDNSHMIQVMAFIEEHLQRDLDLELLSEQVHLHPQYVSRLFKRETGFSITQFITFRRLKKAKHLLAHTEMTVTEISEQCGFADANYFTRVFKKHEGMTPTQFQQQATLEIRTRKTLGHFIM
ncbi:MAG TPA: helix-turn-helix domain-containing protein [Brevibacillus sp.]|nr:helix-turn-helix domain-containing protein [Brevibacillus sp.]